MSQSRNYEALRLNALYEMEILGSPVEPRFDRITRLAKLHFGVEAALLNFIDEHRLWCKSCCGADVEDIDRRWAFCDHTIRQDDALVVNDLSTDLRFADNPLVTADPGIRFYAGYPIREPTGFKVGALCLLHDEPRPFSPEELDALKLMAEMVERELESDRRLRAPEDGVDVASLSQTIARAQNIFLTTESDRAAFTVLLEDLLKLTESPFGLIGELKHQPDGRPFLRMRAITNLAWNKETDDRYRQNDGDGMIFEDLDNLLGQTILSSGVVVSNDLGADPRSGGTPEGHPPLRTYLGMPVVVGTDIVGIIGLANRAGGYSEAFGRSLEPLCRTVGVLMERQRLHLERAQTRAVIEHAANYDSLTELPNRRLLNDLLDRALQEAECLGHQLSICFIDLDGFKEVNDRYGHTVGDAVLAHIGRRLGRLVREGDIIARLSGDEFIAVLRNVESDRVYQRLVDALARPISHEGRLLRLSGSMGVTRFPQDHSDRDILIRHADQAMYAAKEAGRNCYVIFDLAMHHSRQERLQILDELRAGLKTQQLELFLQPKVQLCNRKVEGFEALIRWHHPLRGLLTPDQFLPALDTLEDETWLGEYVLGQAIIILQTFEAQGLDYCLSINISPRHFLSDSFVVTLTKQLTPCSNRVRRNLILEIVESTAIDDLCRAVNIIEDVKKLGVSFSLDDFGTGFSSLSYFRKLPVEEIKIDRTFVTDMLSTIEDRRLVSSIINMAQGFGRRVVAEGIESEELAADLICLGCDLGQGYHYMKPAPVEVALEWARTWHAGKRPEPPAQRFDQPV